MQYSAYAFIGLTGQEIERFELPWEGETPETFSILKSIRRPVWVTSAYIDHTLYRHKYLVDAVMYLRDNGNSNAHLTLFAPEELEKYDIAITPDLPYPRLFGENHASWVPTYKNEYGIMSWMLNQVKD